MKKWILLFAVVAMSTNASANYKEAEFTVEVQNVMAGNALSPTYIAVLKPQAKLFELGREASPGIAEIAETGSTTSLEQELAANPLFVGSVKVNGGPILVGQSRKVTIKVTLDALKQGAKLHAVSMIGRSNDSFIGLVGIPLANLQKNVTYKFSPTNYDAGSEENTGNIEDFGPGGHPIAMAEGIVTIDRGLNPRGNAGDIVAWSPIAAIVKITRVK